MEPADIYDDLDDFNLGDTIAQFDEKNKVLTKTVEESEKRISVLANEVSTLKKVNADLKVNISELYKTAKAEIERKTRQISDLRREMDDTVFRRNTGSNSATDDKHSQEKSELMKEVAQFKHVLNQKDRIINSLNKELENVKTQRSDLKRNSSHMVNETDDTVHKRQKSSNFERDSEHFGDSKPYWISNYRPKEFDERRNRSGSRSPDRRPGYRRNSDFRPVNDRRLNQFKGRYDTRGHCNNRQFNNRFKYNKDEHDLRKSSNSHSRSPEFQDRQMEKGQGNKFTYNNYNSGESNNRSETCYNLRTSVGDRREDTAKWCEKTSEPLQNSKCISKRTVRNIHPVNCPPLISQTFQKNGNYRREDLEEGELNSTCTDNNEDNMSVSSKESNILINPAASSNANRMTMLKEDIRNIVRIEDILDEGKCKDKLMESSKIECVNSDKKIRHANTISGSRFKNTRIDNSSASTSACHETNTDVKLMHKSSTKTVNSQRTTQQVTHPSINASLGEPPLRNHTTVSISNQSAQSSVDASRCEPPKQNHTSPPVSEQATDHCIDVSLSKPPMQNQAGVAISKEPVHPCIDTSLSEPPIRNHTSPTTGEQAIDLCTDASFNEPPMPNHTEVATSNEPGHPCIDSSLSEPPTPDHIGLSSSNEPASLSETPTKNHTSTPTSDQSIQPSTYASLNESSMLNRTDSSVSEQSSQNITQLIPKKKITARRRRCIISIT